MDSWKDILPYTQERMIEDVEVFKNFIALSGREGGLTRVWIMDVVDGLPAVDSFRQLNFKDDLYEVNISVNRVWDTNQVRHAVFDAPATCLCSSISLHGSLELRNSRRVDPN